MSAPASTAMGERRLVFWGVTDMAHTAPELLICPILLPMSPFFYRFGVRPPEGLRRLLLGRRGQLLKDGVRVVVPRVDPLQVEDAEAARLVQQRREGRGHHRVHGRGHHGDVEHVVTYGELGGSHVRIDSHLSGDDGHLVESVGPSKLLKQGCAHLLSPLLSSRPSMGSGGAGTGQPVHRQGECCTVGGEGW